MLEETHVFLIAGEQQSVAERRIREVLDQVGITVFKRLQGRWRNEVYDQIKNADVVLVLDEGDPSPSIRQNIEFALACDPAKIILVKNGGSSSPVQTLLGDYYPINLAQFDPTQAPGLVACEILALRLRQEMQARMELEKPLRPSGGTPINAVPAVLSPEAFLATFVQADPDKQPALLDNFYDHADAESILDTARLFYQHGRTRRRAYAPKDAAVHLNAAVSFMQKLNHLDRPTSAQIYAERSYALRDLYYVQHDPGLLERALADINTANQLAPGNTTWTRDKCQLEQLLSQARRSARSHPADPQV